MKKNGHIVEYKVERTLRVKHMILFLRTSFF